MEGPDRRGNLEHKWWILVLVSLFHQSDEFISLSNLIRMLGLSITKLYSSWPLTDYPHLIIWNPRTGNVIREPFRNNLPPMFGRTLAIEFEHQFFQTGK